MSWNPKIIDQAYDDYKSGVMDLEGFWFVVYPEALQTFEYHLSQAKVGDGVRDIFEQSFATSIQRLSKFVQKKDVKKAKFSTYLHTACQNAFYDGIRKCKSRGRWGEEEVIVDLDKRNGDFYLQPDQQYLGQELREIIQEALANKDGKVGMSNVRAQCFVMRHMDGMSIEEISSELDLPQGTVKSNIKRTRDILRQKLERSGYDAVHR